MIYISGLDIEFQVVLDDRLVLVKEVFFNLGYF